MIANITALLAAEGKRIGVIDTNIQSPGLHIHFKVNDDDIKYSLNDYLSGKCDIHQAVHDVTPLLNGGKGAKVLFIPASSRPYEIVRTLNYGYDVELLNTGFQQISEAFGLDVLLIDPQSGLNEEALALLAISQVLVVLMRPDQQDYQGTSIMTDVARKFGISRTMVIVNEVPTAYDLADLKKQVTKIYNCEVAALLPHSEDLITMAGQGIFVQQYPDHPLTAIYKQISVRLTE